MAAAAAQRSGERPCVRLKSVDDAGDSPRAFEQ